MFCYTVLSSFTLFTQRKLKVHYQRKEGWERGLWSRGRWLKWWCSPQSEVLGLSCSWDWDSARGSLAAQVTPCLAPSTSQRLAHRFLGRQVWLGGGEHSGQPLQMVMGMLVGPRGWGEGTTTRAQQGQGAGRWCWIQHQRMEVTLLHLLS